MLTNVQEEQKSPNSNFNLNMQLLHMTTDIVPLLGLKHKIETEVEFQPKFKQVFQRRGNLCELGT